MLYNLNENLLSDISLSDLYTNLLKKLNLFFEISNEEKEFIYQYHTKVLTRLEYCVKGVDNKYFIRNGFPFFSYIHSGQYLIYLYYFSNEFSNLGLTSLKDKFYYLNKILNSVDIYADVDLPDVFFLEHPVGTVLGRTNYGNNFFAMQGCTIGGNKNKYPSLGDNLTMFANSKILGDCTIGNNVTLGANTYIKDTDIKDNSLVFGQYPNLIIKQNK